MRGARARSSVVVLTYGSKGPLDLPRREGTLTRCFLACCVCVAVALLSVSVAGQVSPPSPPGMFEYSGVSGKGQCCVVPFEVWPSGYCSIPCASGPVVCSSDTNWTEIDCGGCVPTGEENDYCGHLQGGTVNSYSTHRVRCVRNACTLPGGHWGEECTMVVSYAHPSEFPTACTRCAGTLCP